MAQLSPSKLVSTPSSPLPQRSTVRCRAGSESQLQLPKPARASVGQSVHIVQANESLAAIATRYAVSSRELKELNWGRRAILKSDNVEVGQQLLIPSQHGLTVASQHTSQPTLAVTATMAGQTAALALGAWAVAKLATSILGQPLEARQHAEAGDLLMDAKKQMMQAEVHLADVVLVKAAEKQQLLAAKMAALQLQAVLARPVEITSGAALAVLTSAGPVGVETFAAVAIAAPPASPADVAALNRAWRSSGGGTEGAGGGGPAVPPVPLRHSLPVTARKEQEGESGIPPVAQSAATAVILAPGLEAEAPEHPIVGVTTAILALAAALPEVKVRGAATIDTTATTAPVGEPAVALAAPQAPPTSTAIETEARALGPVVALLPGALAPAVVEAAAAALTLVEPAVATPEPEQAGQELTGEQGLQARQQEIKLELQIGRQLQAELQEKQLRREQAEQELQAEQQLLAEREVLADQERQAEERLLAEKEVQAEQERQAEKQLLAEQELQAEHDLQATQQAQAGSQQQQPHAELPQLADPDGRESVQWAWPNALPAHETDITTPLSAAQVHVEEAATGVQDRVTGLPEDVSVELPEVAAPSKLWEQTVGPHQGTESAAATSAATPSVPVITPLVTPVVMGKALAAPSSRPETPVDPEPELQLGRSSHLYSKSVVVLKADLLEHVYATGRGTSVNAQQRSTIEEYVAALETRNPGTHAFHSMTALSGRWKLVYTTSQPTLLLLSALDALPLVAVTDVYQEVDAQSMTAKNRIDVAMPLPLSLRAEAGWEARTPRAFKVRVTKVGLDTYIQTPQLLAALELPPTVDLWGTKLDLAPIRRYVVDPFNVVLETSQAILKRAVSPELDVQPTELTTGWMLNTFLDATMRISRDESGKLFVMLKQHTAKD